ncbi:hypothetical protein [Nocardioides sp.]|uniref:hypothetical protein n=1 Tax=Nocardioides sp. TaxID=35761 RepID=UPI003D0A808E
MGQDQQRDYAEEQYTGRLMQDGYDAGGGRAVPVAVDVVSPGKGLVTCGAGDFSGTVIGRAGSYRDGAARLARHHGFTAGRVEVDFEHRDGADERDAR